MLSRALTRGWLQVARDAAALRVLTRRLGAQIRRFGGGSGSASGRGRLQGLAEGGGVAKDVEDTKLQVLRILYELLKEPDFRAHLLKQGVEAAERALKEAHDARRAAEAQVADAGGDADAHAYTSESTELTREEARGNAFVSTEQYKAEHADFLQVHAETMREIFVLETLRKKIVVYCLTGVWPTSGYLQPAAKAAAVRADTLAQMRAAARGVYVTKGIRDGGGGL